MPEEKEPVKQSPKTKSNRKIWWFLGGGCCLLLLLSFIFFGLLPFISLFRSAADSTIPTPTTSHTSVSTNPTSKPTSTTETNQDQDYGETQSCIKLELTDSIPINISPKDPGFKEDTDTHYYQVYGYTPYEVRNQLNECGSKSGGESYDAYTSYYVNWDYDLKPTINGCGVKDATVGIKVDFFYPKWEDPGNAQAGLAERWQTYMTNLEIHENIHRDIALAGAQAIYDAISSMPTYATCDDLSTTVANKANDLFTEYDARNKAYDDETNHGETQEAVFP